MIQVSIYALNADIIARVDLVLDQGWLPLYEAMGQHKVSSLVEPEVGRKIEILNFFLANPSNLVGLILILFVSKFACETLKRGHWCQE